MPDALAPSLLDIHEASRFLSLHAQTVYKWSRLGILPAIRLGGTWRWDPRDLEKFKRDRITGKL